MGLLDLSEISPKDRVISETMYFLIENQGSNDMTFKRRLGFVEAQHKNKK